jgi:hypothetical protein
MKKSRFRFQNFDIHLFATREEKWMCRVRYAGGQYLSPECNSVMSAVLIAGSYIALDVLNLPVRYAGVERTPLVYHDCDVKCEEHR